MRVAVVHDWLTVYGGAERVLEQILACYADADLFALVDFLPADSRGFLQGKTAITSVIQGLPFASSKYRSYLPLMPLAIEQFDLSAYDLVISSSHAVAKGVLTGPDQLHIAYVHTPMRYAWDLQHQYLRESDLDTGLKGWLAKWLLHKIRLWDARTANGVDCFIANSEFIKRRIWKVYRRDAEVIHPPVAVDQFSLREDKEDFFLAASRLVPYKRMALIAAAFSAMPQRQLVIIGDGPELARVRAAAGPNVSVLGYQPDAILRDHLQRARAFVFAAEEDFGILPLEAQACGTPVIALGKGGVAETVRGLDAERPTGVFFAEPSAQAIEAAVLCFEQNHARITALACHENALRFAPARFRDELRARVADEMDGFRHASRIAMSRQR